MLPTIRKHAACKFMALLMIPTLLVLEIAPADVWAIDRAIEKSKPKIDWNRGRIDTLDNVNI